MRWQTTILPSGLMSAMRRITIFGVSTTRAWENVNEAMRDYNRALSLGFDQTTVEKAIANCPDRRIDLYERLGALRTDSPISPQ